MTATTQANWIPEKWSSLATVTYRSNLVNVPLLDHRWEKEIAGGGGDTVNIPNFTQNASTYVTARSTFGTGAALTFTANTESQTQLVINTMTYTAYRIPVELKKQFMPEYLTQLSEGAALALQLYVDNDVAAGNTNGFDGFSTVVGTDNVDITEDDLLTAETDLANNNAPLDDRFCVLSPASRQSVLKIESVRNSLYRPAIGGLSGSKGRGALGKWMTLNFYESNNLESGTSGKKNAVFQREAIAYAEQQEITAVRDMNVEDGLFNQYVYYMTYGIKEIKDAFGVELAGK